MAMLNNQRVAQASTKREETCTGIFWNALECFRMMAQPFKMCQWRPLPVKAPIPIKEVGTKEMLATHQMERNESQEDAFPIAPRP